MDTTGKPSRLTHPKHPMPAFVRMALDERGLAPACRLRPHYQRNDYLGWIARARLLATRQRRLDQMLEELARGNVYMKMPWKAGSKRRP